MLLTTNASLVTYPVLAIDVEGVKCRALIDTGTGSSYASSKLINKINKKPICRESKRIKTLMHSEVKKEIYQFEIGDINQEFKIGFAINKLEKEILLELPNPNYPEIQTSYNHLKDIINHTETNKELPVHVILEAGDYTKIKNQERARVGQAGEPITESTKLGWVVIFPGQETSVTKILFSKTSVHDYENLCNLDVLGVKDEHTNRDGKIYDEFQRQLGRSDEGWYETNLIWKEKHPPLNNNKSGSLGRLNNLLRNLSRNNQLETYDDIIREQQKAGIVETVDRNTSCQNREFYMPHKAVIRESAQTTKVRIVNDASAKPNSSSASQNDCLEPAYKNLLWDILVRTRLRPVLLCGDIEKPLLLIRIRENDRDALRFH